MVSPLQRRAAAEVIMGELDVSQRKACQIVGISRTTLRRPLAATSAADPDAAFRQHLREYAAKHPRWGYRRAHHDAVNSGWRVNHKKTQRIWREEGLRVPVRRRRKRRGESTTAPVRAVHPNHVWAIDFQYDTTDDGRRFRSVSIIDEYTRESLADHTAVSITGSDVVALIDRIAARRGYSKVLRCDNGPEFVCSTVAAWAGQNLQLLFIPPGQPWHNGYVESFHSRQRDECLNINIFGTVTEARAVITRWHKEYNTIRPHSALGYKTPVAYAADYAEVA
jgi:putative transposase